MDPLDIHRVKDQAGYVAALQNAIETLRADLTKAREECGRLRRLRRDVANVISTFPGANYEMLEMLRAALAGTKEGEPHHNQRYCIHGVYIENDCDKCAAQP